MAIFRFGVHLPLTAEFEFYFRRKFFAIILFIFCHVISFKVNSGVELYTVYSLIVIIIDQRT